MVHGPCTRSQADHSIGNACGCHLPSEQGEVPQGLLLFTAASCLLLLQVIPSMLQLLGVISVILVGHLGPSQLAAAALGDSLANVTGKVSHKQASHGTVFCALHIVPCQQQKAVTTNQDPPTGDLQACPSWQALGVQCRRSVARYACCPRSRPLACS